jgi:hypothetical protein
MHIKRLQIITWLMVFAIIAGGCDNDPDEIGIGIQPESEKLPVLFTDTLSINTYSVFVDSVRTDETTRSMLGSYFDPVFGSSTVSMAFQLALSSATLELGEGAYIDSIVMDLEYTSASNTDLDDMVAYGDTTTLQTFNLFELDETIYADSIYYSNYQPALKENAIATKTFTPHPTDSILIDTTKYKARLRIKMDDSFVQKFRDASSDDFASLEGFLEFLNGIYIQPEEMTYGGAILFFNSIATNSGMKLYYSNNSEDSLVYNLPIASSSARFMNFAHNYNLASPEFQNQLNGNTSLGDQQFYVQCMAGVETIIEIPYFRDLNPTMGQVGVALNEAKLIISNSNPDIDFAPPGTFVLFSIDEDGTKQLVLDQLESGDYFGATYDESTNNVIFRLSQQLQRSLAVDTIPLRFSLGISGASILPNRMVGVGSSPIGGGTPLKMDLIFTKLNNN